MRMQITVSVELLPDADTKKPVADKPKAPPTAASIDRALVDAAVKPFQNKNSLSLTEVISLTGLSRGEIESAVALGRLQKPFRRGRGIFWPEDAVRVFVMKRRAEAEQNS